jgi:lysyl-tRNA synthetase class 2
MMEFYAAYWNHHDLMDFTEQVIRHAAIDAHGTAALTYAGQANWIWTSRSHRLTVARR